MKDKAAVFHVFHAVNGKWHWNIKHGNGKIIADGAQGYASMKGAVAAVGRIRAALRMNVAVTTDATPNHVWLAAQQKKK